MVLIDTDVLIECLRGSPDAKAWLQSNRKDTFAIPGVVAMELIVGYRNQTDIQETKKFLEQFAIAWPEASEFTAAYALLAAHRLASGIGIPDCLIAATALARGARLFTFNLKHFQIIPGLDVQRPYLRP